MLNEQSAPRAYLPPVRLPHLDGIRGMAALYVAIFHAYQMELFLTPALDPGRARLFLFLKPLCMGHYAVTVFIVLSGYCLMLPVARAGGDYTLKGGMAGYYRRRARRILPAFYASVLLTMALLPLTRLGWTAALAAGLPGVHAALSVPAPARLLGQFLSHCVLINNGIPIASESLVKFSNNTPLWSVATEWQIYFLFPALLLPVLRRFGPWCSIFAGILVSVGFAHAFGGRYAMACPWMLGVFGLGMLGALITHAPDTRYAALRGMRHWGKLSALLLLVFVGFGVTHLGFYRLYPALVDLALGFAVMCGLVSLAGAGLPHASRGQRWCGAFFSAPAVCALGGFSYSLYLLHYPLLILSQGWLSRYCPSLYAVDAILLGPVMAGIVIIAWLFSRAFELPFMGERAKASRRPAPAAALVIADEAAFPKPVL
ncbi:MAG TPA: acyltransferase [Chthoniobacteraceae bacterium]|nr:acyltransferase [Chthoniobacteraceae bacterium]